LYGETTQPKRKKPGTQKSFVIENLKKKKSNVGNGVCKNPAAAALVLGHMALRKGFLATRAQKSAGTLDSKETCGNRKNVTEARKRHLEEILRGPAL